MLQLYIKFNRKQYSNYNIKGKKMKNRVYAKKMLVVVVCQLLMAIGGSFLFCSNMGNDPFGVMTDGISKVFGVTYGTSNFAISVAIVIICMLFHRKNLSFTTLVTAVVPGLVLDFYIAVIQSLPMPIFIVKYIYPFVGCAILGSFIACYLTLDVGASTIDNIVLWVADIIKGDYRKGYFICSAIYLLVGIPLGGTWGYATFVTFFCAGNVVKLTTPFFERTVGRWARK